MIWLHISYILKATSMTNSLTNLLKYLLIFSDEFTCVINYYGYKFLEQTYCYHHQRT